MRKLSVVTLTSFVAVIGVSTMASAGNIRSASDYFLSTGPSFQSFGDTRHRNVSETFTLVNGNNRNLYVRRIGADEPGLELRASSQTALTGRLTPPTAPGPIWTVPPHQSIQVAVSFHVSDCATVPKGTRPLTLGVAWRVGNWHRVNLTMPNDTWPRSLTDTVCQ